MNCADNLNQILGEYLLCLRKWEEESIVREIIVNITEQQIDSYFHLWDGRPRKGMFFS